MRSVKITTSDDFAAHQTFITFILTSGQNEIESVLNIVTRYSKERMIVQLHVVDVIDVDDVTACAGRRYMLIFKLTQNKKYLTHFIIIFNVRS